MKQAAKLFLLASPVPSSSSTVSATSPSDTSANGSIINGSESSGVPLYQTVYFYPVIGVTGFIIILIALILVGCCCCDCCCKNNPSSTRHYHRRTSRSRKRNTAKRSKTAHQSRSKTVIQAAPGKPKAGNSHPAPRPPAGFEVGHLTVLKAPPPTPAQHHTTVMGRPTSTTKPRSRGRPTPTPAQHTSFSARKPSPKTPKPAVSPRRPSSVKARPRIVATTTIVGATKSGTELAVSPCRSSSMFAKIRAGYNIAKKK